MPLSFRLVVILLALLLALLLGSSQTYAQPAIILDHAVDTYRLDGHLEKFTDESNELTLTEITSKPFSEQFTAMAAGELRYPYGPAVWMRFTVKNPHNSTEQWILELGDPRATHLDIHLFDQSAGGLTPVASYSSGRSKPFTSRPIATRNFTFPLELPAAATFDIYVRVHSLGAVSMPVKIYSETAFVKTHSIDQAIHGIFYGIMFAMLMYNVFILFTVKEKHYFFYVLYVLFLSLTHLSMSGWGFQYLWPNSIWLSQYGVLLFGTFTILFLGGFAFEFFPHELVPKTHNIGKALVSLLLLNPILGLMFGYHWMQNITALVLIGLSLCAVYSGFIYLRSGLLSARLYILGWFFLVSSALTVILHRYALIDLNFPIQYVLAIGAALEVIFFAFALAAKLNQEKQEKYLAQKRAAQFEKTALLEQQNAQKNRLLAKTKEEEAKAKSQFLATMSHEIRTPLNGVIGVAEMLNDTPLSKQQKDLVGIIKGSGDSLICIINDILDFSKIEAGKMEIESLDFDLLNLCNDMIAMFRFSNKCKEGVELSLDFDAKVPRIVLGDPTRIRQIMVNFLGNALKFTERGSVTLCVKPGAESDSVRISVKDTGMGLTQEQQQKLFSSYSQAEGSTARKFGGTGLGLAICKKLVQLFDGEIGVISKQGEGSEFWINMPLPKGDDAKFSAEATTDTLSIPADLQVLVAEDNPVNRVVATHMLKKLGIAPVLVEDGEQALEAVISKQFDIVMMDCEMPVLDGFQATTQIRHYEADQGRKPVPIIALTAHVMREHREKCLACGMNIHLAKPLQIAELNEALKQALALRAT